MGERYMIEESLQQRYVATRDAQTFLPFLLPHLRPGMDILDAGCGVGSIALDLARRVAPGHIVGIDVDPAQIEVARRSAAERELDNAEFKAASVYQLPFADGSFDIVYSNAVLVHIRERVLALTEMRRVLRPGGLAAVSDDDWSTIVVSPDRPEVEGLYRLAERVVAHGGGDTRYSRHIRSLMLEAGFARTRGVATAPEVSGDAESTRRTAEGFAEHFGNPGVIELVVQEGWASRVEIDRAVAAMREWAERPDAFVAWLYCGALGWKS